MFQCIIQQRNGWSSHHPVLENFPGKSLKGTVKVTLCVTLYISTRFSEFFFVVVYRVTFLFKNELSAVKELLVAPVVGSRWYSFVVSLFVRPVLVHLFTRPVRLLPTCLGKIFLIEARYIVRYAR